MQFKSMRGRCDDDRGEFSHWDYSPTNSSRYISQQPMPVHINLWLFKGLPPKNGQEVEIVIQDFKFTPE